MEIDSDNQLNDSSCKPLPDKEAFEEYTTIELLSVSMLIVISTFALDFIHSDRSIFCDCRFEKRGRSGSA